MHVVFFSIGCYIEFNIVFAFYRMVINIPVAFVVIKIEVDKLGMGIECLATFY